MSSACARIGGMIAPFAGILVRNYLPVCPRTNLTLFPAWQLLTKFKMTAIQHMPDIDGLLFMGWCAR